MAIAAPKVLRQICATRIWSISEPEFMRGEWMTMVSRSRYEKPVVARRPPAMSEVAKGGSVRASLPSPDEKGWSSLAHVQEGEEEDDARRHAHAHERGRLEHVRLRVLVLELGDEEVDVQAHDGHPHGDVEEEQADPALEARAVLRVVDLVLRGVELRRPEIREAHAHGACLP